MAFAAYGTQQNTNTVNSDKPKVDFQALNKYVVETADIQEPTTLVGYVAVIADLGMQKIEDASVEFKGTAEDEASEIEKNPNTYFEDGKNDKGDKVRLKRWKQKDQQCVAIGIDIPEIIIDKGQFFGESTPLPLRLWLGGEFYENGKFVVNRPTVLKVVNIDRDDKTKKPRWSFDKKHIFHKMAVADKLIDKDGVFKPERIDELLGKAFQFEVQICFDEKNGKHYYQEKIKFVGGRARGMNAPELLTTPCFTNMEGDNPPDVLKNLRNHIVNTMHKASNWETSKIKGQLEALRNDDSGAKEEPKQPETKTQAPTGSFDPEDDDIPF